MSAASRPPYASIIAAWSAWARAVTASSFGFGVLGYLFRRLEISVLPFVIAFILAGTLEDTARQAFAATGGDPFFLLTGLARPYMGFAHVEIMLVGHNWFPPQVPPRGQHYERWFHADGCGAEKMDAYRRNAGDTKGAAQTWHSELPVAWHNSTWTADRAIEWLKRDRSAPFCVWASFPDPHHPFDCPEPWSRLHDPADVDLPVHRRRTFEGRPWWHEQVLTAEPGGSRKNADLRKRYSRIDEQTDEQLREIIANTYGQIALIDHNVGRILIALEEADLARDTVVVYFSNHGDWLGDHGLVLKGPMHYEGLLRVPLVARGPETPAGQVVGDPVSTLDLAPTMFDYSGVAPFSARSTGRACARSLRATGPGSTRSTSGSCCRPAPESPSAFAPCAPGPTS